MIELRIRKGWQVAASKYGGARYFPPGADTNGSGWFVSITCRDTKPFLATAHGKGFDRGEWDFFPNMREAHEWLLSVGSESPWEVAADP